MQVAIPKKSVFYVVCVLVRSELVTTQLLLLIQLPYIWNTKENISQNPGQLIRSPNNFMNNSASRNKNWIKYSTMYNFNQNYYFQHNNRLIPDLEFTMGKTELTIKLII